MRLLAAYVDLVIFCDIDPDQEEKYREFCSQFKHKEPKHQFICGDAQDIVKTLSRIDVLFHRNDSWGEGGSAVPVLSYHFLPYVLDRMPNTGGIIITDGSNSLQSWFERISRPKGVERLGWFFKPLEYIKDGSKSGLCVVKVKKCAKKS